MEAEKLTSSMPALNSSQSGEKTRVALLSVMSNTLLVALKLIVGVLIGSVSVISEAIHSGVNLLAALIALFAVKASGKPADRDHPFGHGKFENLSGTIEAFLIFCAAGWIIFEAVQKLIHPTALDTPSWGVAVMLFSSVINIIVSRRLFRVARKTESVPWKPTPGTCGRTFSPRRASWGPSSHFVRGENLPGDAFPLDRPRGRHHRRAAHLQGRV